MALFNTICLFGLAFALGYGLGEIRGAKDMLALWDRDIETKRVTMKELRRPISENYLTALEFEDSGDYGEGQDRP